MYLSKTSQTAVLSEPAKGEVAVKVFLTLLLLVMVKSRKGLTKWQKEGLVTIPEENAIGVLLTNVAMANVMRKEKERKKVLVTLRTRCCRMVVWAIHSMEAGAHQHQSVSRARALGLWDRAS